MSDRGDRPPGREQHMAEAVAWYTRAAVAGRPPDRAAFLARFPDLRPELEAFLAKEGAADRTVARASDAPQHPEPGATAPPPVDPNNVTATRPPMRPPPG